jgi:hypothetical protein
MPYRRLSHAAKELGLSTSKLRQMTRDGEWPDGVVIATAGGQYRIDVGLARKALAENYRRLTRAKRIEGKR